MTDTFYTNLRDDAVYNQVLQFGFEMVLVSSREPTIDPNTGAITTPAVVASTPVIGLYRFYSQKEIDGKDILTDDRQALIEAKTLSTAGITPDTSMQLTAKGKTYNVIRVTPTEPGGIPVLFRIQIRQ